MPFGLIIVLLLVIIIVLLVLILWYLYRRKAASPTQGDCAKILQDAFDDVANQELDLPDFRGEEVAEGEPVRAGIDPDCCLLLLGLASARRQDCLDADRAVRAAVPGSSDSFRKTIAAIRICAEAKGVRDAYILCCLGD